MSQLFLAMFLVLLSSALCSGTEAALFSVPLVKARQLAQHNKGAGKALLAIRENMGRPIATIVILNNIANIVGSIAVGGIATNVLGSQWLGLVSGVLTFLVIIFSEIIPKTVGERYAEKISLWVARPVQGITYVLTPLVWLVEKITAPITKGNTGPTTNEGEIRLLARIGQQEGIIEKDESEMIQQVFTMNDVTAADMMTPRIVMTYLPADVTLEEVKEKVITSPHSRIVVIGETTDDVIGIVWKNKLLTALIEQQANQPVSKFAHSPQFIPEGMQADQLLNFFKKQRRHLAIVLDEFGGVAGVVTLEDVLETLTGAIIDETDRYEDLQEMARQRYRRKKIPNRELPVQKPDTKLDNTTSDE